MNKHLYELLKDQPQVKVKAQTRQENWTPAHLAAIATAAMGFFYVIFTFFFSINLWGRVPTDA